MYKLSKTPGKYRCHVTQGEYAKCRKDCIIFKEINCINKLLDHVLKLKGEAKRTNNKFV